MDRDVAKLAEEHPVGFCKMPRGFSHMPSLSVSREFMAPSWIDNRNYMTPTEDQGRLPWCAAFAAANWAESILWKRNGYIEQIDPAPLYKWAKEHDGAPCEDGTSLTAVLSALLALGHFDAKVCSVRTIRPNRLAFKHAMHAFGCVLAGFDVSSAWFGASKETPVIGTAGRQNLGGHAVILAGYTKQHVHVFNSWGPDWGEYGFARLTWEAFDRQVKYGAVLSHCLDGLTIS